ncbi:excise [Gordonia phage Dmitri]|nr:excise [Gordonia phage Dmitri]
METPRHEITVQEAVKITGLTRRSITYAARHGKLSARKLPGRTGAYLLDLDEVRRYAALTQSASA